MLAASKPCARNTARAPSMICRRLARSCRSAATEGVADRWVLDMSSCRFCRFATAFYRFATAPFSMGSQNSDRTVRSLTWLVSVINSTPTEPFGHFVARTGGIAKYKEYQLCTENLISHPLVEASG